MTRETRIKPATPLPGHAPSDHAPARGVSGSGAGGGGRPSPRAGAARPPPSPPWPRSPSACGSGRSCRTATSASRYRRRETSARARGAQPPVGAERGGTGPLHPRMVNGWAMGRGAGARSRGAPGLLSPGVPAASPTGTGGSRGLPAGIPVAFPPASLPQPSVATRQRALVLLGKGFRSRVPGCAGPPPRRCLKPRLDVGVWRERGLSRAGRCNYPACEGRGVETRDLQVFQG